MAKNSQMSYIHFKNYADDNHVCFATNNLANCHNQILGPETFFDSFLFFAIKKLFIGMLQFISLKTFMVVLVIVL
jgi:hypothetical protein